MIEEIAVSPFVARRVQRRIGSVHLQPFSYREVEGLHCLASQAKALGSSRLTPDLAVNFWDHDRRPVKTHSRTNVTFFVNEWMKAI